VIKSIGLTVTVVVAEHPVGRIYEMSAVPPVTPVTIPVVPPTTAIAVFPLLHVPPDDPSVNAEVEFAQTVMDPVITPGNGLTVIETEPAILLVQPVVGLLAATV
jgi:hypothetical protein